MKPSLQHQIHIQQQKIKLHKNLIRDDLHRFQHHLKNICSQPSTLALGVLTGFLLTIHQPPTSPKPRNRSLLSILQILGTIYFQRLSEKLHKQLL